LSLITLILLTLDTSGLSLQEQGKPLKTETKDYYETWQAGAMIEMPASGNQKDEIIAYIHKLWEDKADTMIKIVACESNFRPEAINWQDAKITGWPSQGITQINAPYNEELFNWKYNLDVAFEMYQRRGFQPWSCAKLIK